jgi:hypothetical protein
MLNRSEILVARGNARVKNGEKYTRSCAGHYSKSDPITDGIEKKIKNK